MRYLILIAVMTFPIISLAQRSQKSKKKIIEIQRISHINTNYCQTEFSPVLFEVKKVNKVWPVDSIHDIILIAQDHPFFPMDNSALRDLGREMMNRNPDFCDYFTFSTGKEFLESLKILTRKNGYVKNLCIVGHSGYEGFFAEDKSGFHRTEYQVSQNGKVVPLSSEAATISDLVVELKEGRVKFSSEGVIVLAGCNTAYGENNFAFELAKSLKLPVIGSNHKIDLFNVVNKGEELSGKDGTFFVYMPVDGKLLKFDLQTPVINIANTIQQVKKFQHEVGRPTLLSNTHH